MERFNREEGEFMYAAPFPFLDYQTPVLGCFLLLMKKFLALVIIALSDVVGAVRKKSNVGDLNKSFHENAHAAKKARMNSKERLRM